MKKASILAASLMCSVVLSAQTTREDAVLFSGTELDESYLLADNVSVVFDSEGKGTICVGEAEMSEFVITNEVTAEFKDAFKLTANQDPNHKENYYSTFFTKKGAYKVPTATNAYAGKVEKGEKTDVLKLTDVGTIIHQSEAVILKATGSDITLMPSCNKDSTSTKNALEGTDEGKNLTTNQYALSLGQNGVGFYLWDGKPIGANKAYLTLVADDPPQAKAFTLKFDNDEPTGINNHQPSIINHQPLQYNLNGMRVGKNYKGVVIKNGKKVIVK